MRYFVTLYLEIVIKHQQKTNIEGHLSGSMGARKKTAEMTTHPGLEGKNTGQNTEDIYSS